MFHLKIDTNEDTKMRENDELALREGNPSVGTSPKGRHVDCFVAELWRINTTKVICINNFVKWYNKICTRKT
jgi:hypothetical protein